jgi:hypothetical protein
MWFYFFVCLDVKFVANSKGCWDFHIYRILFGVIEIFIPLVMEVGFDFHTPYISSCLGT